MASAILDQILSDIKAAMKAKDAAKLTALRGLNAAIKDQTVNAGIEVTDEEVVSVIAKAIKQRTDSVDQYTAAKRQDLVDKEQKEIDWIRVYQPRQLERTEIEKLVRESISESGATCKKEMGKVMQVLMPKVKGKADGKLVSQVVQSLLP